MCGRYTMHTDVDKLIEQLKLNFIEAQLTPAYNIAPTQNVGAIVETEKGRLLKAFRWGLVPHWAKDLTIGNKMINARAETLGEKPSFRSLIKSHRCVIPADGFYEWKKEDDKSKTPYFIHRKDDNPFALAGLWAQWKEQDSDAKPIQTFTIITTSANELMEPLHHRMPVILPPEAREEWLNPDNEAKESLLELLVPYEGDDMEAYAVSTKVNSPRNQGQELIVPTGTS